MIGRNTRTIGTAHVIQVTNAMLAPVVASYTPMNTTFGGVPMGVPMPPMLAA
jgi:hypothetical protein